MTQACHGKACTSQRGGGGGGSCNIISNLDVAGEQIRHAHFLQALLSSHLQVFSPVHGWQSPPPPPPNTHTHTLMHTAIALHPGCVHSQAPFTSISQSLISVFCSPMHHARGAQQLQQSCHPIFTIPSDSSIKGRARAIHDLHNEQHMFLFYFFQVLFIVFAHVQAGSITNCFNSCHIIFSLQIPACRLPACLQ